MQSPRAKRHPFLPLASLLLLALGCGPIGPIPGRALSGPVHDGAPPDWSFVAEIDTIQVETRPEKPYSVNTWVGAVDGRLYVPTSLILGPDDPNDRSWVAHVRDDPRVRLRIDGVVYEMIAVRVDEPEEREAARRALLEKYDERADAHATQAWIFRMDPR